MRKVSKEEVLAIFDAEAENTESWDDVYGRLLRIAHVFMADPSEISANHAIVAMSAFIDALKELPEEGDIVIITKHMNRYIVDRMFGDQEFMHMVEEGDTARTIHELISGILQATVEQNSIEQAISEKPQILH